MERGARSDGGVTAWRVLLVDDEAPLLQSVVRALRRRGALAEAASSLAEGRAKVRAKRWDAVVLDLRLGDGDGLELVAEIRARCPESALVAISGYLDAPRVAELQERGVALVPKPCSIDLLVRMMRLQKERAAVEGERLQLRPRAWSERVRVLLDGRPLARDNDERLSNMLRLILDRTLEGRGASWQELAGALGRDPASAAADTYVRQQVFVVREQLREIGILLKNTRRRGYFFEEGDF